jgi:hypothetical protein
VSQHGVHDDGQAPGERDPRLVIPVTRIRVKPIQIGLTSKSPSAGCDGM